MYKIKLKAEDFIVEEIPLLELKDKGNYTCFLLEKKNYNTEKVIQKLSKYYKIPRKKFGYAGNKDKFAITKQYCSVKGHIKDIEFSDIKVKIVGYLDNPISLGDLKGNKFTINVENVSKKPVKTDFIINYFDEQRFGRHNLEVGLAILKKDFKRAAELLEVPVKKNDYIGAIRTTPFKILKLIINSVQSYLWNEVAASYIISKAKEYSQIKYKHGIFIFSKNKLADIELPLVSFDTEFDNKEIEELYLSKLKELDLTLRDFVIRSLPDLTAMGNTRNLIADVNKLSISKIKDKKVTIKFQLGKGSYATIVIKKLLQ